MLQPFLDPYPWASESLSLGCVTKKKIVPITIRPRTQVLSGYTIYFQCKFHQESLVSILRYGFRPEKLPGLSRNESLTKRIYV